MAIPSQVGMSRQNYLVKVRTFRTGPRVLESPLDA